MKTLLMNNTGFEIEFETDETTYTVQPDGEVFVEEVPDPRDIVVYNEGDCDVFIGNGYTTNGYLINFHIREIYIG